MKAGQLTAHPTGTVTFLFTDIEGSTKLARELREAWEGLRARHHAILDAAIRANNGYAFKIIGDAFCAAFHTGGNAVQAAIKSQLDLQAENWGEAPVRVRMGIHTGKADLQEGGDYAGYMVLSRVQRLMSAGHGGQVLISTASQELLLDDLPEDVSVRDMGERRLKDLIRPEHIFQLIIANLPADFPPLKTLDAYPNNLPVQLTSFVGREKEMADVKRLLATTRLLTLTGPGGTGKTRLSLQAAADMLDEYAQGVFFVPLETISDPDLVIPSIASTLGVRTIAGQPVTGALKAFLGERQMLLVLDNFEQLVSASPQVASLLADAPKLKIMISSREVLRVRGEHAYPVPPLGLPERGRRQTVAVLSQFEAVALFIQRAMAARPDFEVTNDNAPAVAEICFQLDGLPLAIELAAARSRMLTPQAMLEKLSSHLKTLTGGARDLPARQQTIRAAIDWSHDLLDDGEKRLFARLGVFSGGWTLAAAEAVCGAGLPFEAADGLESLLDKNLVRQTEGVGAEPRFGMLETIREYAVERLTASSEADALGELHAEFYAALVESINNSWTAENTRRVTSEDNNVRRAAEWSLAHGQPQVVVRFASVLLDIWGLTAAWREKIGWLEQALTQREALTAPQQSDGVRLIGALLANAGEVEQSRPYNREALQIARACGYKVGIVRALNNEAYEAIELDHDPASARQMYLEAQAIFRELGDKYGIALVTLNLADVSLKERDLDRGRAELIEAVKLYAELNDVMRHRWAYMLLIRLEIEAGRFEAAREAGVRLVRLSEELGVISAKTFSVFYWALLAAAEGEAERAARLLGYFEAALETQDLPPMSEDEKRRYDRALEAIHAQLDAAAFKAAWEEGRALTVEQALACVLEGTQ